MSIKSFRANLNPELSKKITDGMHTMTSTTNQDFLEKLVDFIPLCVAVIEKGMSIEQAIDRIRYENVKTELKIIKKGINEIEFEKWKERLYRHNDSAPSDEKVFLTQRLFITLIGGNVQSISKLYRQYESEIEEHNKKYGLDASTNMLLSRKLRREFGSSTIADWLKYCD